jgi:hypothetical protein
MSTQGKKNKKNELIPDINKVEELKGAKRKSSKKEQEEETRRTGPSTTREEEKDPKEYPMK